jgi:uncharacterized protein YegJ (DUF2314 family)
MTDDEPFDEDQDEPIFMALPSDDPDLLQAAEHARATAGRFRKLIANRQRDDVFCSAKLRFRDPDLSEEHGEDRFFYVWVHFVALDGDEFVGETIQAPRGAPGLQAGQVHRFRASELHDWMVNDSGHLHGGFSLRLMRQALPEHRRAAYDRYIGAISYE